MRICSLQRPERGPLIDTLLCMPRGPMSAISTPEQHLLIQYPKSSHNLLLSACRDGEASAADMEDLEAAAFTRRRTGDRPVEAKAAPLKEVSKLPAGPLPTEPWADLDIGLHHQHGSTAQPADQQQQGHGKGLEGRRQPQTLEDEAEQVGLPSLLTMVSQRHGDSRYIMVSQRHGDSR